MKNILLVVHDDAGQAARLQVALDVTRAVEGHLTCLDVSIMPALLGDYYSGAGEAMLLADERAREGINKTHLEARLAKEDLPWDWVDATGALAACTTSASTLSDLIIVNRQLDGGSLPDMRSAAAEVIAKSGRPILAVPETSGGLDLSGKVLVAWDGSACSAAALRAAVPLLHLASAVTLFEVDDGSIEIDAEQAATYLSRHGVHAAIHRQKAHGRNASDYLLEEARRHVAYIVMGGFGHARWTEALFGGVTRKMLSASPVPLFLAH